MFRHDICWLAVDVADLDFTVFVDCDDVIKGDGVEIDRKLKIDHLQFGGCVDVAQVISVVDTTC